MRRWSSDDLRRATLRRQFPESTSVLDLMADLAPIQSQVPRAPFLTMASRRPGTTYAELVTLFEAHQLIKASTLRGTVFTSDLQQFAWSQRIAREGRQQLLAALTKVPVEHVGELLTAVEEQAADWRAWEDLLDHARGLMTAGPPELASRVDQVRFLLWGQAGLIRRPPDAAWHKRTDVLRRAARVALPELPTVGFDESVVAMVGQHLRAYGPVTKDDSCFYLGIRKTPLNQALAALGDRVLVGEGPDGRLMYDWADDLSESTGDPEAASGVRLLADFDGCLLGYAGPGRLRFCTPEQLALVWNAKNAVCAPTVLHDGRIVARWKTVGTGRRVRIEVTMLPPHRPLREAAFDDAVAALAAVLDLEIHAVRVT